MAELFGFCAKKRVQAVLTTSDGLIFAGENICTTPQDVCPREPGEGYEKCKTVCGQLHHAEIQCLMQAGEKARGASIAVNYHYCCEACSKALRDAGVIEVKLVT